MTHAVKWGERRGSVTAPASKSMAHRMLICAALSENESTLTIDTLSDDIRATIRCLCALGANIRKREGVLEITPIPRPADPEDAKKAPLLLPCGESGSTLRFLLPLVGALGKNAVFLMEGRLPLRPTGELTSELIRHGMTIRREESRLCCAHRLTGGEYILPGNVSSQYVSALLFALPLLKEDSLIRLWAPLESASYVDMTRQALAMSGIVTTDAPDGCRIGGGQRYAFPRAARVEGDWSNAAAFLCMGAFSHEGIRVDGLDLASKQGDREIIGILRDFGAEVRIENDSVTVRRNRTHPLTLDARDIPDLVPVVSALCCGAAGESRIVNAARLRLKESDRLKTTCAMLRELGADIRETADGLVIHGTGALAGGETDARGDHRIAMAAAVAAGLCAQNVIIKGAECVNKSFPTFFDCLDELPS